MWTKSASSKQLDANQVQKGQEILKKCDQILESKQVDKQQAAQLSQILHLLETWNENVVSSLTGKKR